MRKISRALWILLLLVSRAVAQEEIQIDGISDDTPAPPRGHVICIEPLRRARGAELADSIARVRNAALRACRREVFVAGKNVRLAALDAHRGPGTLGCADPGSPNQLAGLVSVYPPPEWVRPGTVERQFPRIIPATGAGYPRIAPHATGRAVLGRIEAALDLAELSRFVDAYAMGGYFARGFNRMTIIKCRILELTASGPRVTLRALSTVSDCVGGSYWFVSTHTFALAKAELVCDSQHGTDERAVTQVQDPLAEYADVAGAGQAADTAAAEAWKKADEEEAAQRLALWRKQDDEQARRRQEEARRFDAEEQRRRNLVMARPQRCPPAVQPSPRQPERAVPAAPEPAPQPWGRYALPAVVVLAAALSLMPPRRAK